MFVVQDVGAEKPMAEPQRAMTEREKAKSARRNHIVAAAIGCFIENGIHQTGIRDIAAKAEVSLGNLYNHFTSKDALICEIAALEGEGIEQFKQALTDTEDPCAAVGDFVDGYLDHVSKPANAILTIEIIAEALRNPAIAAQFETNRGALIVAISATIERGIKDGAMRKNLAVEETVLLLLDMIEGQGLRSGLARLSPSLNARKTLHEMILRMLRIDNEQGGLSA